MCSVHGDDCTSSGSNPGIDWMEKVTSEEYEITIGRDQETYKFNKNHRRFKVQVGLLRSRTHFEWVQVFACALYALPHFARVGCT